MTAKVAHRLKTEQNTALNVKLAQEFETLGKHIVERI